VIHRVLISVVLVAVALGLACVDMTAPKGPASISELRLPSPSLVVGDTMRDSTGTVAPLVITAFDANGNPAVAPGAQFFITDTTKASTLARSNLLIGNRLGSSIIIGQLGTLQTSPVNLPVTNRPAKLVKVSTDSLLMVLFSRDTTVDTSVVVSLNVLSAQDSASQGIIVRYALARTLSPGNPSRPAVVIADANSKPGTVDTSSATGSSSRHILVFPAFLGDTALTHGNKTDTIIVEARASYAKAELTNSPIRFIIPVKIKLQFNNP
jgi:hypothetical protein